MAQTLREVVQSQVDHLRQLDRLVLTPQAPDPEPRHAPDGRLIRPRQGLYTPRVTLWTFLAQIFCPNHSCRQAVFRLIAFCAARGERLPCEDTSVYCKARQRLPESFFAGAARQAAQTLQDTAPSLWLWKGRHVTIADGTTVSMPDTPANQRQYPQAPTQKPGLGFPIARLVALISLATGAVLDLAIGAYQGKQTGETALFRQLWERLRRGDLLLGDCVYGSYFGLAPLVARGVDALVRMHQRRQYDFGLGQLLGVEDHIVEWIKPARPAWMSVAEYEALPATLRVRELRLKISVAGFRVQELVLVTTLLDAEAYTAAELGALFRQRWNIELDLRSIKSVMQMDVLRCETPEMVRKEIWVHLLGYNLIRQQMSEAAVRQGCAPRELSFAGALQACRAFGEVMELVDDEALRERLRAVMLEVIGRQRVGDRPDRVEPRAVKRRPKPHDLLNKPRKEARKSLVGAN